MYNIHEQGHKTRPAPHVRFITKTDPISRKALEQQLNLDRSAKVLHI